MFQSALGQTAHSSRLVAALIIEFSLEGGYFILQLQLLPLQGLVVGHQLLDIGVGWLSKTLFDEFNHVLGLLLLLVQAHEDLGELVDDAGLLEVLAEILLLLLSCLD